MNKGEWVAFGTLVVTIIGLGYQSYHQWLGSKHQRIESDSQKKMIQVMMDYISVLRDNQKSIEHAFKMDIAIKNENIQIQKERLAYDKMVAAAKTIGWFLDRED